MAFFRQVGNVVLAASGLALAAAAQQSGSALMVRVEPEAHLSPTNATVSFLVANPSEVAGASPITITAWVRSLPGQQIQLVARLRSLKGPDGPVDPGAIAFPGLSWTGTMASATGGAVTAVCSSGVFDRGLAQQLISGWSQSGIARCTITFSLATQPGWHSGTYTGELNLSLSVQ